MPKYRLTFRKEKPIRFISHLDMVKVFERAVRRGEIPVAFSQGFNPHPKISFALPIPVGVTADEEFIDLELKEAMSAEMLKKLLNNNLPQGLQIMDIIEKEINKTMMSLIDKADYLVVVDTDKTISKELLERKIRDFLTSKEIIINKRTKKNIKPTNILPGIFALRVNKITGNTIILEMRLKAGNQGNIRPEDVLKGLNQYQELNLDISSVVIHRNKLIACGKPKE